ncbi:MAG: N-acetylmuramic acid 6-phosphate etherase [Gaiellaceae bacterium]
MPRTDQDDLVTEARGGSPDIDLLSSHELVELMNDEDELVASAVRQASAQIADTIDAVVDRLERGGRLLYVGAGSSGAVAALDAAECETTFALPPGRVAAIVAGVGLESAAERDAAEDDAEAGAKAVGDAVVTAADAVLGISASGRTPFVVGAIEVALAAGALTGAVVSAPDSPLSALVDHEIVVVVGPEFLAGSTRLKAGTAQKLVLNTISTVSMVRTGKTFGNLMVDVRATNDKLRARVRRIVELATGTPPDEVEAALEAANGEAKVAIVSLLAEVDAHTARSRLDAADGRIRAALGS